MTATFLAGHDGRTWESDRIDRPATYHLGAGPSQLEVVVITVEGRPTKAQLQRLYRLRRDGRANPVLAVAVYADEVGLCGPTGEEPPVYRDVDRSQAERVCAAALEQPDRFAAHRFLTQVLPQLADALVGIHNQGLLSTHELRVGVPERDDWADATERATQALRADDPRALIRGLDYEIERLTDQSSVLKDASDGHERAVAMFLQEDEAFDLPQERFVDTSPVAYALNEAEKRNLDYVIGSSGRTLRLYTTRPDAGFGSRGKTDTYVEVNADLLGDAQAGYLWLLFSAGALREQGTLDAIMERSRDYAADLGGRLRDRIYEDVVPDLAEAIARERDIADPTKQQLDATYEMALVMLYRLLFIAYAEDEEFLPRRRNERYAERSLKRKARDLHAFVADGGSFDSAFTDHWDDVMRLSRAIHRGHEELGLPAYDGRLLSEDPDISAAGARLAEIRLDNAAFGPVLVNLLIDETEEGVRGPVDFRNIGVREFGVIYEGLLESELSVADEPLGVDADGRYEPVDLDAEPDREVVDAGEVYLHGQSGERKATGTYYTKRRFVEHILEYSLEPALDEHIERIDRLRTEKGEQAAARAFFDLRVADIAMGSGHFLVGAVDRIESRLYTYLTEQPLAPIQDELKTLREAALDALPSEEYGAAIEDGQLLRRQVARRCIYGVDLNPLATELARLSIWVHTFVPGLPLTFLEYNLITGDSLAGIGTLDEVSEILDIEQSSLGMFAGGQSVMNEIRDDIHNLGRFADASAEQVQEARETRHQIEKKLEQVRAKFDIMAASRIDDNIDTDPVSNTDIDITKHISYEKSRKISDSTNLVHFPAAFPEVFDSDNPGFDTVLGNPPWQEATMEKKEFWSRYIPGLQGMSQTQIESKTEEIRESRPDLVDQYVQELEEQQQRGQFIKNGPYPGAASGGSAPDSYKAFSWRFRQLLSTDGYAGLVLPRSAFSGSGSEEFRRELLTSSVVADLTFLKNNRGWVFDNMHQQYTIALLCYQMRKPFDDDVLPLRGPYPDVESYNAGLEQGSYKFNIKNAKNWTGSASFPLLPSEPKSVEVFQNMATKPPLGNEDGQWYTNPCAELNAGTDKKADDGTRIMHFVDDPPGGYWPVFKGASFDIWNPDTGIRYAWADPDTLIDYLQEKRENSYQYAGSRSSFSEFDKEWIENPDTHPCNYPRIAFRDVTNRTNRRTVLAALLPPEIALTDKGPYLLWPRGNETDEAYLLGVLSSIILDWYARRFVETGLNYHIFKSLPIPRPGRENTLRQRVVELSGRLAAVDDRYAEWADAVGVEYGPLGEDTKQQMIYELDAVVAHLYGLTREHVEVIFETFHDGWDYEERLAAVLEHYDSWADRLGPEHTHQTETAETDD